MARAQVTFYVRGDGSGSDANAGTSWGTAFATIQKGMDQLNATAPSNNVTLNIQASTPPQAYYVASKSMPGTALTYNYDIQGGWTDVGGTPTQNGYSLVSDTISPIDQPGLTVQGGNHGTVRTVNVCRVNFTNVTYGIYVSVPVNFNYSHQSLIVSNVTIAAENHGIFMDYLNPNSVASGNSGQSRLIVRTSAITGGLSGNGDGIRINGSYVLVDLATDVAVSTTGGMNLNLRDLPLGSSLTNAFRGTFGAASGGYDMVKYGRTSASILNEASSFTRNVSLYGGSVQARAQSLGRPLGTGTTEVNNAVALKLDGVAGTDATFGPIAVRSSQPLLWVNGVSGGGTWTADAITRENRAVLVVRGNTGVNWAFTLGADDKLKLATPPAVTNGMVAPWMLCSSGDFLNYDPVRGFTNVVYSLVNSINSVTATDRVQVTVPQGMTANRSAHALWLQMYCTTPPNAITNVGGPWTLTLGSGGLSAVYPGYPNPYALISPNVKFGASGEKEALVFVGSDYYNWSTPLALAGNLITTNGLTKSGFGVLRLDGDNSTNFAGPVNVQCGTLQLNNSNALPAGLSLNIASAFGVYNYFDTGNTPINQGVLDLLGNNLTVSNLNLLDRAAILNTATTSCTLTVTGDINYKGYDYVATIAPGATNKMLTLNLGSTRRTFNVADGMDSPDLSISTPVIGTGGLLKMGPGRMDLVASNNSFSGGIVLKDGMLTGWLTTNAYPVTPFGDAGNTIDMTNTAVLHFYRGVQQSGCSTAVGRVTCAGGNQVTFTCANNFYSTNTLAALNRATGTRGVLLFQGGGNTSIRDFPGQLVTLLITETPSMVNGMLPAWIVGRGTVVNSTASYHLTYDTVLGVKTFTYDKADFTGTSTQKVNVTAAQNVTANKSLWALRAAANITQSGGSWTLVIGNGGLLLDSTVSIAPAVQFGATSTDEALVYVNLGACGTLANSIVTTGGLTKFGDGIMSLAAASPSFSGPVWVQAGAISLGDNNALGSGSDPIYLQTGTRLDLYCNATLARPVTGPGAITTGPNLLTVAAGGSLTPGFPGDTGTLLAENLLFGGTYNWKLSPTGNDLIKAVNLAFTGSPKLNVSWLGTGTAPLGTYEVFRYTGANPSLAGWTVKTPISRTGTLSLDTTGKRVLLTISKTPGGILMMFR